MLPQELINQVARIWLERQMEGGLKGCPQLFVAYNVQIEPDEGAFDRITDMESAIREVERVAISKLLGG
jgi:hypothetical protein